MLSWSAIAYGGALSAFFAALAVGLTGGEERRPAVAATAAAGAAAGVVAWNVGLRLTDSPGFAAEAPGVPLSWKAAGSALGAFTGVVLGLGFGPARSARAATVALLALLAASSALLLDSYLY